MRIAPITLFLLPALAGLLWLSATTTQAEPKGKPALAAADQSSAAKATPPASTTSLSAGSPSTPPAADPAQAARRAEVLASFGGGQVTVGDLEDAVNAQSVFMRKRYAEPDALKALLDKTVRFELLALEAARRGYDKNDSVLFAVKQNAVQVMVKQEFDDKITPESIPAEDVKKYYAEHIDEFVRPELRRASQLRLPNEPAAKALLAEAKAADMRAFRELSRNRSVDEATKLRGGDLGYFDLKGHVADENQVIDPALAKAAFALKTVGDTSEAIKIGDGYSILKLTGQRAAHEETPKAADQTIRMRLWRERRQAGIDGMVANLKAQLKPEVHPELLDAIKFDAVAPLPPAESLPAGFPQGQPVPAPKTPAP
ncbi:MAG TPA: peptidylprolyl isomerase [Polyangiales bacterium]